MNEVGLKRIVILHLGNYMLMPNSGVAQKTFAMADCFRKAGVDVLCVAFPYRFNGSYAPSPKVEVIFEKKALVYKAIINYFRTKIQSQDLVLFRYPFATPGLLELVKEFGHQVIFEHNTIESVEELMLQRSHLSRLPFSLRPDYLRYAIQTRVFKQTDETRLGPLVLAHALGGICVSQEIAEYEMDRCKSYPTTVVSNGVYMAQKQVAQLVPFQNELRVCMMIGSPAIWHGYDRMFSGLLRYSGQDCRIAIDIIGMNRPDETQVPNANRPEIQWLGVMSREEIARHLGLCHMAIGTLALFRKEMQEASPLKVRECLMLGMPMLLGYYDTDVSRDARFKPFILQVTNTNEPIDWHAVVEFYRNLANNEQHRMEIAALAGEVLSMQKKTERYLAFIRERLKHSGVS